MLQYCFRGLICLFLQLALHNLLHFWTLPYVEYFLNFPFISIVHCTLGKLKKLEKMSHKYFPFMMLFCPSITSLCTALA